MDLLNRSDVRLGIDEYADDLRVINGIVRGREMPPLLIKPFRNEEDQVAGFEQVRPDQIAVMTGLSKGQRTHWDRLPAEFMFEDVADCVVPRSSLSRLINRMRGFGALRQDELGKFHKVAGEKWAEP